MSEPRPQWLGGGESDELLQQLESSLLYIAMAPGNELAKAPLFKAANACRHEIHRRSNKECDLI